MNYRDYNPETDKEAVHRIWLEVGWIEKDKPEPMDIMIEAARTIVSDVNGRPECLVVSFLGDIDYMGERIPLSCIGGVTTSLVARRLKLAGRLTAKRIAMDAMEGSAVSCLGMFEQGFYNMLGYGSGGYENIIHFSPGILNIDRKPDVPVRIETDDWEKAHRARLKRMRKHGTVAFDLPEISKAEMIWVKNGFGYGYLNDKGEITHHIWMSGRGKEWGPYWVEWMSYTDYEQFLELMALLKSFGEQIKLVKMIEPPGMQVQDFLRKPFYHRNLSQKSPYENKNRAEAWWQMRICDLEKCMAMTHLKGAPIRFNLELSDPIEKYLDDDSEWKGCAGEYVVTVGEESEAKRGSEKNLPTLKASVNAFTRMWLGIQQASILAVGDDLQGPADLLESLDEIFRLPIPKPDWQF